MKDGNVKIKLRSLEVGFFISGSNSLSGFSYMGGQDVVPPVVKTQD